MSNEVAQAMTATTTNTQETHNIEVFEGHLTVGDTRIAVSFAVPIGATQVEKDAAFVNALPEDDDILVLEYYSMGTMHQAEQPPMLYWAVSGRIPGDDEDVVHLCTAATRKEAIEAFEVMIWENEPGDDAEREEAKENVRKEHGTTCFITSVISSRSPMTEH